ncbi:glycosyl hydrolase family 47 [Venturia nashicola]|uniref:alpha-1,2-Mannosidase n=1 Tax=Venturia nashicola TaxID=86259 RepID=A0A4Z1P850_9PEZI|nr:glycosyl hydrolase family 47 [Venturia nashicola]
MQKHRKRTILICLVVLFLVLGAAIITPVVIITRRHFEDQQRNGFGGGGGGGRGEGGLNGGLNNGGAFPPGGQSGGQPGGIPGGVIGPQTSGPAGVAQGPFVPNEERANAVREAFQFAWQGYRTHAFPHDELKPGTNTPGDTRNGWGATAVDAFDLAVIMRLPDVVADMLNFIPTIDFTRTPTQVSVFETNIRYIGGMLAGYDLLKGPFSSVPHNAAKRELVLKQAVKLADLLCSAFQTPSGLPDNILNFNGGQPTINGSATASIATIGSLVLEWARLSHLTDDPKYARLTQTAQQFLLKPSAGGEPFPGLIGQYLRLSDGAIVDTKGGWGPESDSFYEYLIKMFIYKPSDFANYRDRWTTAADSSMQYLASKPASRPQSTLMAHFDGTHILPIGYHLDCFAGGNFLLGGAVLKQQNYIDFGLALTQSCRDSYAGTVTGIGPEAFAWFPETCGAQPGVLRAELKANLTLTPKSKAATGIQATVDCSQPPPGQDTYFQRSGLWIKAGSYNLRPEVLESYYYAYRITKNPMYQEWAWEAFQAINTNARLAAGFNVLGNVDVQGGANNQANNQESFFFAETLKASSLDPDPDSPQEFGTPKYPVVSSKSCDINHKCLVFLFTIGTLINYRSSKPSSDQLSETSPLLGNRPTLSEAGEEEKWYRRLFPDNTRFRENRTSKFLNHFPFLVEILYWNLTYWPYQLSRALSAVLIRNNTSIFTTSRHHALSILDFERSLHLSLEQPLQSWLLQNHPYLIPLLALIYYSHITLSILFLVYTYTYLPRLHYQKIRRAMALCNILAFTILSIYRVMPPRLLPHSQGFKDILHPSHSTPNKSIWTNNRFQLTIAAMPSEHFGMASLISYSLTRYSPHLWLRILAPLWAVVMLFTIVATANHYLLDAVVGGLVTVVAFWGERCMLVFRPVEECMFWVARTEKPASNDEDPPSVKGWGDFARGSWR